MGKKGKKTRWRRLPIGGTDEQSGLSLTPAPPTTDHASVTFNEDEYTKITTPRQDVLFKKGYFGRKRSTNPSSAEAQEVHSGDSAESESFISEEPQHVYPAGYMDPSGVYYINGGTFETYDPYTGTVTVVVAPPAQYPGGAPVLAALPCQPVPLQPVEWFNPSAPWCYSYNRRKRYSTDSQNCSAQSSESTGPPGSPQESVDDGAYSMYPPQYVYPGYMFGPPIYNMNGVTVQGMIPQPVPMTTDLSANKRRKKRRRKRRGGVTDDGSESSCCEEPLMCDVPGCQSETSSDAVCQSGASSDAGAGPASVSSKANSDSGINTDPTPNSGSNSPPLHPHLDASLVPQTESVNNTQCKCEQTNMNDELDPNMTDVNQISVSRMTQETLDLPLCSNNESVNECVSNHEDKSEEVVGSEEVVEELSTTEDDITPNLCAAAPEFSSQESTLSCLSTPSATRDLPGEHELSNFDMSQEITFQEESVQLESAPAEFAEPDLYQISDGNLSQQLSVDSDITTSHDDLQTFFAEENELSDYMSDNEELNVCDTAPELSLILDNNIKATAVSKTHSPFDDGLNSVLTVEITETDEICEDESDTFKEMTNVNRHLSLSTNTENCLSIKVSDTNSACLSTIAPVPPPRRKRSMCRAADKFASKIVEEAIKEGMEEAACLRLRSTLPITEAVTRWLASQGNSPLTCPTIDSESEDDESIEIGEELTDQKNVQGNPFLAPYHNGAGQRVAKDCESMDSSIGEWDLWDHNHTRDMCDPTRSVDKYYRLGADEGVGDRVPPSVYKTAMHMRHTGPFPCGVCCIIQ